MATVEVALAIIAVSVAVVWEQFVPTIAILVLAGISLAIRREGLGTLGFNNTIGLLAFFLIGPIYGFW